MRLDDGTMRLIVGGSNTEINLHDFIGRITSTLKADLGESADAPGYKAFRKRVLDGLASHDVGWFFGAGKVAPADAAKEVATVAANIDAVIGLMRTMNDRRLQTIALLQAPSYAKVPNPPSLTGGALGLIETSGLGSVGLVRLFGADKADTVLPPGRRRQTYLRFGRSTHVVRELGRNYTRLCPSANFVHGCCGRSGEDRSYCQCEDPGISREVAGGTLSIPDRRGCTAPGEATYKANCAGCHAMPAGRPRNDLVFDVGTDPLRSQAVGTLSAALLTKVVMSICPQTQAECAFGAEGPIVDPSAHRGYVAGPLIGVCAVAPYLHNGSVLALRCHCPPAIQAYTPLARNLRGYEAQRLGGGVGPFALLTKPSSASSTTIPQYFQHTDWKRFTAQKNSNRT